MKKFVSLLLVFIVVFSFASCKGKKKTDPNLIGVWTIESSKINSVDKSKSMMFELMSNMYFFEGATIEFRNDGKTSINGMIGDYSVPRPNVIETTNAQGEVTECTYNISGDTLVMSFYSDEYVVTLSKGAKAKKDVGSDLKPGDQKILDNQEITIPMPSSSSEIIPEQSIISDIESIQSKHKEFIDQIKK